MPKQLKQQRYNMKIQLPHHHHMFKEIPHLLLLHNNKLFHSPLLMVQKKLTITSQVLNKLHKVLQLPPLQLPLKPLLIQLPLKPLPLQLPPKVLLLHKLHQTPNLLLTILETHKLKPSLEILLTRMVSQLLNSKSELKTIYCDILIR